MFNHLHRKIKIFILILLKSNLHPILNQTKKLGVILECILETASYLSEERDHPLCAILVHVWKIDLITEQHQPLAQLDRGKHNTVGGAAVLAVVIKSLEQQFWSGGAGEVQSDNLMESSGKVHDSIHKICNLI